MLGFIASIIGLCISIYIHIEKKKKTKLICPREANCEKVIHSTHSVTLGIPNELLGILYYSITGIIYVVSIFNPSIFTGAVVWLLAVITTIGALFSIYLIALQGLVIRTWCLWCLGSAFATLLLVISLFHLDPTNFFQILKEQRIWWVIMHNIGFILGLGGATITDIFFFRFLKDNKITEEEKGTMDTLTNVIWVGLAILIVSGIMLYLPEQARLDQSPKFLLKVIVVSIITLNGILLNMLVAPRMRMFSFNQTTADRNFRRLAFALGGISITSWYTAFLLGSLRTINMPFMYGLIGYIVILVGVVIGSQIFESIISKQRQT